MRYLFLILCFVFINANAYCISNQTNQTLFFMVESYPANSESILSFKQYIKPNVTKCCKVIDDRCNPLKKSDATLSFYAFLSEKSLEGCDVFGTSNSNIILSKYENFDNCVWK